MTTAHNLRQRRTRLLREIAHHAAALADNPEPATPHKRTAHTRAARCLQERARKLAELPWTPEDAKRPIMSDLRDSGAIEQDADTVLFIYRDEAEKDIYIGCGWKLARFRDGALFGFFDPMSVPAMDTYKEALEAATNTALGWLSAIGSDEAWLVMCSCYQLCEPRRINLDDAGALASMTNRFAEQFEEFYL